MRQSIIMPFHKNKDMLCYTLSLIEKTVSNNVEIIVVGNNNNPEEINVELPKRFKYLKVNKSLLYSKAVNLGVQEASGDIITLCDQDVFFYSDWYSPLLNLLTSNDKIGSVSSKLLSPVDNRIIECGIMFAKTRVLHPLRGVKSVHHWASFDRKTSTSCSAVLMMKKSLYIEVGGMDVDMPYCCSDCDICLKIKEKGLENWICASSVGYHKGSSSAKNSKRTSFSHIHVDSQHMFFAKNYPRMESDIAQWMEYTLPDFKSRNSIDSLYHFVNLSSFGDYDWYADVVKDLLSIDYFDIHTYPTPDRDSRHIQLYDELPYSFMNISSPIIYFVDLFLSMEYNSIWGRMRNIERDLVIDSHGSIFPLSDIIEGRC